MANLRQVFKDIANAMRIKGAKGEFIPVDMADTILQIRTDRYITFTAEEDTTLAMTKSGNIEWIKLLKSTDGVNWTKWENPSEGIVLNARQSVHIKADENAPNRSANSEDNYQSFSSTGKISCTGDIRSIVDVSEPGNYGYWISRLFKGCSNLTSTPELPSANLDTRSYYRMFQGCTSLTTPPELPAATLVNQCYAHMFRDCTSLTQAPELPATTLAGSCYLFMFKDCTSLTNGPSVLPATNLPGYCYIGMFAGCTSLTTAPEISATTFSGNACCKEMFFGCTSLTKAPSVIGTTLSDWCCQDMFNGCTSLVEGPYLKAKTLATGCYQQMFKDCTSLKRIKMDASSGDLNWAMFNGCTSLELVDMTGSTSVPGIQNDVFPSNNNIYKIVVPDSLYDTWITTGNWASIASHIMKQSDWNAAHPDNQL